MKFTSEGQGVVTVTMVRRGDRNGYVIHLWEPGMWHMIVLQPGETLRLDRAQGKSTATNAVVRAGAPYQPIPAAEFLERVG